MTKREFAAVFAYLLAAYPRDTSGATIEVYREHLGDLNYEQVMRSAREHVFSSAYFPTIAELAEGARAHRREHQPSDLTPRLGPSSVKPTADTKGWVAKALAAIGAAPDTWRLTEDRMSAAPGELDFHRCGGLYVKRKGRSGWFCFECGEREAPGQHYAISPLEPRSLSGDQ